MTFFALLSRARCNRAAAVRVSVNVLVSDVHSFGAVEEADVVQL